MNIFEIWGGLDSDDYIENDDAIKKDSVIEQLIPDKISSCSLCANRNSKNSCLSEQTIDLINKKLQVVESDIETAKKKLNCTTDLCVLQNMKNTLDKTTYTRELANLKIQGPTNTELLSNVNIDTILDQWHVKFPDFFNYNFNMRNFTQYSFVNGYVVEKPDTLATIPIRDLFKKYARAACVINSDVYQGPGKHWMCLYVDKNTKTIEFFNSSGNAPAPEWVNWMLQVKNDFSDFEIIRCTTMRHQNSKSECGLYSLFYIWSRLNGVSYLHFKNHIIPDRFMFEFRQHLFYNSNTDNSKDTVFDWNTFKSTNKIKWEK